MTTTSMGNDPGQLFTSEYEVVPRRPRWKLITIVTVIVAALVAALVVVADGAARSTAEDAVEQEIASRLPDSAGPIVAQIGGFAFLPQLFSGRLQQLEVDFSVGADAIAKLSGGDSDAVTIADSAISHEGSVQFLGIPIDYTVSLEPSVDDGRLVLTPTGIEASTDAATVDLGKLVDLDALAMSVCAAELLPQSMRLTDVETVGSRIRLSVSGTDVPTDLQKLKARGSCD